MSWIQNISALQTRENNCQVKKFSLHPSFYLIRLLQLDKKWTLKGFVQSLWHIFRKVLFDILLLCIQFQFLTFHCMMVASIDCLVWDSLVVYLNWNLNISLQHNNYNNNCTIESPVWDSFAEIWLNSQSRLCKHLDCCCEELLLVQIHAKRLSHFHHKTIAYALFIVQLWYFYRFMQEII